MTQEEKELLLKDLSARLPYKVIIKTILNNGELIGFDTVREELHLRQLNDEIFNRYYTVLNDDPKPYLRPMSSMTEEEKKEFSKLLDKRYCEEDWEGHISTSYCIEINNVYTDDENGIKYPSVFSMDAIDWLNKHHFDYRGLIEKGIALEAPEGMYK